MVFISKSGTTFGRATIAGTLLFLDFALANWARRLSKSSAQLPVDKFKNEIKNSFQKAGMNWIEVGLSLLPPCCRMEPKKFSIRSVFNLLVRRNLKP